jgi:cation diffusion facilitator CzcD-associated flavoprotein CzcO
MEKKKSNEEKSLLETRLRDELKTLCVPDKSWVLTEEKKEDVYHVIVIGGGQAGLSCGFSLMTEHVTNILILDEQKYDEEGPWRRFARMPTLRTPKNLIGGAWPLPSLTFKAYYEALNGKEAWENLHRIPTKAWADYLLWYREILRIPVQNSKKVVSVKWNSENNCFEIHTQDGQLYKALEVVVATGSGRVPYIPEAISRNVSPNYYTHSIDADIDFNSFTSKKIAVLGGGASAFDQAIVAANAGAEVTLLSRRSDASWPNYFIWASSSVGFLKHHADGNDYQRWKMMGDLLSFGEPPPGSTIATAKQLPNLKIITDFNIQSITVNSSNQIKIVEEEGDDHTFDHLILGTGFTSKLEDLEFLEDFYSEILRWDDVLTAEEINAVPKRSQELKRLPYLGEGYELTPKDESRYFLKHIYLFQEAALISQGLSCRGITGLKYGIQRLTHAITKSLYVNHWQQQYESMVEHCNYGDHEQELLLDATGKIIKTREEQ